jgi:adenosine deaminase
MIDRSYPLIDLHRHLDGSVRLETILDLGRKHDVPVPGNTVEELRPHVQIVKPQPGVMAFLEKFKWMVGVLGDYSSCRRVAYENVEDADREGLDYVELRFSPVFMAEPHGLDPAGVVEAVLEGIEQGRRDFSVKVNLIGIISRTYGPDQGWEELQALMTGREEITGLDLAGDEKNYPGRLFVDHIQEGREAGWKITIHAGEEGGPDSIWQAVEELQADRIGHGISAVRDPSLMEYLAENSIGVECNLTSNYQTQSVPDLTRHPLKTFLDRGVLATINTDDPGISGITLEHEYRVAREVVGLSESQLTRAQRNSLATAFLTDQEKRILSSQVS